MQTVGEPPGTVERYQQTGCHGQGGGQPDSDFSGAEELLSSRSKNVVARRQAVRRVTKGIVDDCKRGELGYMYSEDFVEPEQTMGGDVDAGRQIKSGQHCRDKETYDARIEDGVFRF